MSRIDASKSPAAGGTEGLLKACGLLTLAVLLFFPAPGWFGYQGHGAGGLAAAAVAGGICWLGATLGLIVTALLRGPQTGVQGVLGGMVFRLGLPLATAVVLTYRGGPLAEAGVFGMIVVYYLLTLAVETWLAVRLVRPTHKVSKAS